MRGIHKENISTHIHTVCISRHRRSNHISAESVTKRSPKIKDRESREILEARSMRALFYRASLDSCERRSKQAQHSEDSVHF